MRVTFPTLPTQWAVKPLIFANLLSGKWGLGVTFTWLLLFSVRLSLFSAPSPVAGLFLSMVLPATLSARSRTRCVFLFQLLAESLSRRKGQQAQVIAAPGAI